MQSFYKKEDSSPIPKIKFTNQNRNMPYDKCKSQANLNLKLKTQQRSLEDDAHDKIQNLEAEIFEQKLLIAKLQKHIKSLTELNKYLQVSNQQKTNFLQVERKIQLKQTLTSLNLQHSTNLDTQKSQVSEKLKGKNISLNISNQSYPLNISIEQKTQRSSQNISFKNLENTEKPNRPNQHDQFKQLSDLMKEQDNFTSTLTNSSDQTLLIIYDQIEKLMSDHAKQTRTVKRLRNLTRAAINISHTTLLYESINTIVDEVIQSMDCDRATCFIYDSENNELWSKIARGTNKLIKLKGGQGLSGQVAITGELLNIRNAYQDQRFDQQYDKRIGYETKSLLICPIMEGKNVIGVLECLNKKGQNGNINFSEEDEQHIKLIAEFTGIVLSRVTNNDQEKTLLNKYQHIIQSGILMSRDVRNMTDLLLIGQQRIKSLMNVEKAKLCFLSNDKAHIYHLNEEEQKVQHSSSQGIMCQAILQKQGISSVNCQNDINFHDKIDIKTNLPVFSYPIFNPLNDKEILGAIQINFLKSLSKTLVNNEIRISRQELEIIHLYCSTIGQFILIHKQTLQQSE